MLHNDCLLRVLSHQATSRLPVWFMRQAGRYLPEYRALRQKAGSFWDLCKTPAYAAEAAMQPIRRYDLDAAILFSDILTLPDAMGLTIDFIEGRGPVFQQPLREPDDIARLPLADMQQLDYVFEAIALTKEKLQNQVPLIGFAGSPITLASYITEGQGSRDFLALRRLIGSHPESAHGLLDKLSRSIADYLLRQIQAGADVVMLFDTWGGLLDPVSYETYGLHYVRKILTTLKEKTDCPVIFYAKSAFNHFSSLAKTEIDALGVDWTVDLPTAQAMLKDQKIILQGNLDPAILACPPKLIEHKAQQLIDQIQHRPHIFNLGHGIPLDTPPEAIEALLKAIRQSPWSSV